MTPKTFLKTFNIVHAENRTGDIGKYERKRKQRKIHEPTYEIFKKKFEKAKSMNWFTMLKTFEEIPHCEDEFGIVPEEFAKYQEGIDCR